MTLSKLVLGSCLALLPVASFAADLPSKKATPVAAPVVLKHKWTGFYLGINGGFGGGESKYPMSYVEPAGDEEDDGPVDGSINGSVKINSSGFVGGAQFGYNFELSNNIVVGVEADYNVASIKGQLSGQISTIGVDGSGTVGSEIDSLGTVRGRLGYTVDRALVYVTGGYAYANITNGYSVSATYNSEPVSMSDSVSKSANGWTVGGGLEYALTDQLTFKTEYLYVDLGKQTVGTIADPLNEEEDSSLNVESKTKINIVRAGLNYHF